MDGYSYSKSFITSKTSDLMGIFGINNAKLNQTSPAWHPACDKQSWSSISMRGWKSLGTRAKSAGNYLPSPS